MALDKFEKLNARLCKWCEWIAVAAMMLMVAITCIDVFGAKFFKLPTPGAIDIVMLAQLVAIAFAAGITMIEGRHIQVEFFVNLLPRRVQNIIDSVILFMGLGLFSAIIWRLCVLGYSFQTSGEYSATIYIPYYPFAYCIALASIPVWLIIFVQFIQSLAKSVK